MKPFKQHIVEKLKIGKYDILTPIELADRIYDSYEVTHIAEPVNSGDLFITYSYFEDKNGNLLFAVEITKEPQYAKVYTVILPDNIFKLYEDTELYDRHVKLYRCPYELHDVIAQEFVNPPRVFFMRGVTDWKENTDYSFRYMTNSRNFIDTKNDIYIKLTNGKI
jgi:hypothetical protein